MSENLFFTKIRTTFVLSNVGFPTLIDLTNLTRETLCRPAGVSSFLFRGWEEGGGQRRLPAGRYGRGCRQRLSGSGNGKDGAGAEAGAVSSAGRKGTGEESPVSGSGGVHERPDMEAFRAGFKRKRAIPLGKSDIFFYFCINWENNELKCRSCMTRQMY